MAGRTDSTIDRVFPLIRVPLIPNLLSPDADLKALSQRSHIVRELLQEAIELQLHPDRVESATPKRLPTLEIPSGLSIERHKRRKLCNGDAVPAIDASQLVASSYASA